MRVVLTQSVGRLEGLADALTQCGFEVKRNPLIRTEALLTDEVRHQARALVACPWLLFTSPAAVNAWWALELLAAHPADDSRLGQALRAAPLIGAIGEKTAALIRRYGGQVDLTAKAANARGLAASFLADARAAAPVALPRGNRALPTLQLELERYGFATRPLVIYKTEVLEWSVPVPDIVVLSSPSAVEGLPEGVGAGARLVALGPSTAAAIAARGWVCASAAQPTVDSLIEALETLEIKASSNTRRTFRTAKVYS